MSEIKFLTGQRCEFYISRKTRNSHKVGMCGRPAVAVTIDNVGPWYEVDPVLEFLCAAHADGMEAASAEDE